MQTVIRLTQAQLDSMITHALADAPVECCGLLAKRGDVISTVFRARNKEASPYRFSIDGIEQMKIEQAIEDAGEELAGFYHSHTGSEARPSPTDIRMMGPFFGPPYVHVVVGVADREHPVVRMFHIAGGAAQEQEYEVVATGP